MTAALLAAGLLVGVAAVALHGSDQAITHDAQASVDSNRDSAIRAVTRQADDLKRTIAAYAAQPAVVAALAHPSRATMAAGHEVLGLLASSKGVPAVVLSDLGGRTRDVYPMMPERIGQDFSARDWFQGAQRTGKPYVSASYRSVAPGHPLAVGIATPVSSGGRRVGYLTLVGQLTAVRAVAEGARQDDGVVITVTDQAGRRLTSTLPTGQPSLASTATVDGIGWTVTASLPRSVALAPAVAFRRSVGLSLGASLLLLVICTGLALRSARRRAAEHELIEVERARLTTLFAASPIGILECDADGIIVTVNDAMNQMLGYDGELVGTRGTDLLEDDKVSAADVDIASVLSGAVERYTRERLYRAHDGSLVPALTSVILVHEKNHAVRRVVAFVVDQREQKRIEDALRASEDRLTELALHDDLTGLANRRMLLARCTEAFAVARTSGVGGTSIAALFIDLDGFKPVNDLQGHERGDQLLVDIAADLVSVVRPCDTVARVGGDEFVVLLEEYDGLAHLHDVAARITRVVRREVTDGRTVLAVTASVGVASIDLAIETLAQPDQLLSRADTAMYRAKELGRDRHDVFEPGLKVVNGRAALPPPRAVLY